MKTIRILLFFFFFFFFFFLFLDQRCEERKQSVTVDKVFCFFFGKFYSYDNSNIYEFFGELVDRTVGLKDNEVQLNSTFFKEKGKNYITCIES